VDNKGPLEDLLFLLQLHDRSSDSLTQVFYLLPISSNKSENLYQLVFCVIEVLASHQQLDTSLLVRFRVVLHDCKSLLGEEKQVHKRFTGPDRLLVDLLKLLFFKLVFPLLLPSEHCRPVLAFHFREDLAVVGCVHLYLDCWLQGQVVFFSVLVFPFNNRKQRRFCPVHCLVSLIFYFNLFLLSLPF